MVTASTHHPFAPAFIYSGGQCSCGTVVSNSVCDMLLKDSREVGDTDITADSAERAKAEDIPVSQRTWEWTK